MIEYFKKQFSSFAYEWNNCKSIMMKIKLIWLAFVIWAIFFPLIYLLMIVIGACTLNNPHKFAMEAIKSLS